MNLRCFTFLIVCVVALFSCGKHSSHPQNMLTGTWSLQQQHVFMYQDTAILADTTFTAAATAYGTAQFNADGTYTSSSAYLRGNGSSLSSPPPSDQKTSGTYSYSDNIFIISPGLCGWYNFAVGTTGAPANVSDSVQITQLTASRLTVHTDNKFTATTSTGIHNFEMVFDYVYSK